MKKYLKSFILLIGFMVCSFVHAETEITYALILILQSERIPPAEIGGRYA